MAGVTLIGWMQSRLIEDHCLPKIHDVDTQGVVRDLDRLGLKRAPKGFRRAVLRDGPLKPAFAPVLLHHRPSPANIKRLHL